MLAPPFPPPWAWPPPATCCGTDEHVVCVAGDAAFTCGVSFEALNNVASTTKRLIVVLNDNEWSIAKNVGRRRGIPQPHRGQPILRPPARQGGAVLSSGSAAKKPANWLARSRPSVKNLLAPSVIFDELGLRYYGPIDGHDIPLLVKTFEFLKTQNEPVILHILTKKGKGYAPAAGETRINSTASANSTSIPARRIASPHSDLFRTCGQDPCGFRRSQ